ncbi:hypothetical protein HDU67_008199 [Dinochytrium kinnereticum]|nr:hypothetical protein HDU67_008199 [Dinochytrium kinnereticum]
MLQDTIQEVEEAFKDYENVHPDGEEAERVSFLVASGRNSADAFFTSVSELQGLTEPSISDRLGKAMRTHIKEAALKMDSALRREVDKLLQNVIEEMSRVLEISSDHSEEEISCLKDELISTARRMHFAEDIETGFTDIQSSLAVKVFALYTDLVGHASEKVESVVDSHLRSALQDMQKLNPKTMDTIPTGDNGHEHVEPTPPPIVPRPQPPVPTPRPVSHPVDNLPSTLPIKPRPMSVAVVESAPTPSSSLPESPRKAGFAADLNRMLAVPPKPQKPIRTDDADPPHHSATDLVSSQTNDEISGTESLEETSAVTAESPLSPSEEQVKTALSVPIDIASVSPHSPASAVPATPVTHMKPTPVIVPPPAAVHAPQPAAATHAAAPSIAPPPKKKGVFKGILSSLTKSRPKAARKGSSKTADADEEPVMAESSGSINEVPAGLSSNDMHEASPEALREHIDDQSGNAGNASSPRRSNPPAIVSGPSNPHGDPETESRKSIYSDVEVPGSHSSDLDAAEQSQSIVLNENRKSIVETEEAPTLQELPTTPPRPVPRPRPAPPPRRLVSEEQPLSIEPQEPIPPEPSPLSHVPRPPRPAPRPSSMASNETIDRSSIPLEHRTSVSDLRADTKHEGAPEAPTEEEAHPDGSEGNIARSRKIPGVFMNQQGHGAMAALASAMTGRQAPPRPPKPTPSPATHQHDSEESIPHETEEVPFSAGLKKKENSVSGDDKAIEKNAIEWLNTHLASRDIHIDNLYTSLIDGLNLIYALEACTGESIGKYNKRAMLSVHKIDNIAVALNFLKKKGIDTQFLTPQDIMNEDRSKILTLFNYILKVLK